MTYLKEAFEVSTFEDAKNVVLTTDPNDYLKFENETIFLVDKILDKISINDTTKVLDFGCGIGRVSKELISRTGCTVVGTDISESMLTYAKLYVASLKKFFPTHTYEEKESIDVALSVFVLQHVEDPVKEIEYLYNAVKPGGYLIYLNENYRYVPIGIDKNRFVQWKDDSFNLEKEIENHFKFIDQIPYMKTDKNIIFYRK